MSSIHHLIRTGFCAPVFAMRMGCGALQLTFFPAQKDFHS